MQSIRKTSRYHVLIATSVFLAAVFMPLMASAQTPGSTLDRIRLSGQIRIGYLPDARPFSYRDPSGTVSGYSVVLCQKIVEQVKAELKLPTLAVKWVPVTEASRFTDVQQGRVDLLCGADTETLARRKSVSFSIPIFPGGIAALMRKDSPYRLREILTKGQAASRPFWRAAPAQILEQQTFSVVAGTTSERWLYGWLNKFQLSVKVVPVGNHADGIKRVLDRRSNVFFGERAILLDAVKHSPNSHDLIVLDRHYTSERLAIVLPRGDDDFRLLVDRTLSRLFTSPDFRYLYAKWFGEPNELILSFLSLSALPE